MPKKARELSAISVSKLKINGRFPVGGVDGLQLRVMDGSRSWILRIAVGTRIDSKGQPVVHRRDMGLGAYPEISLSEAREKASELRKQVRDGVDPVEQKSSNGKLCVCNCLKPRLSVSMQRLSFPIKLVNSRMPSILPSGDQCWKPMPIRLLASSR